MQTNAMAGRAFGPLAILLLGSTALASPAFAQDKPASPAPGTASSTPSESEEKAIDSPSEQDIVVTATRRNTLLEETPIAETAFGAATIERQRLYNFTDVAEKSPGLVFTPFSRQESYLSIRGTTVNNDAPGSDLGVSVFIDDVPTTGVGDDNPDLFDLQSIEVLRGPQGTLFGRNVTGGAVVVRTLPPSFDTQFKVQGTYGSQNLAEMRAYLTGAIVPGKLAGKITFEGRRQDGLLNNVALNNKTLSTNIWGVRGQLLWTPSSNFTLLVGGDYTHDTSPYKVQQIIGNFQPSLFPTLSFRPNDTNQGINSKGNSQVGGAVVRAEYTAPWGTITSISGMRLVDNRETHATAGDPFNVLGQRSVIKAQQYTEELRFASDTDGRFTWVGGFFFLASHRVQEKRYDLNVLPGTLASLVDPYSALVFTSFQNQYINARSYAAYGEANYALTPTLKLTLGARYSIEKKSGRDYVVDTSGLSSDLVVPFFSHTWSAFTPKATLTWKPDDDFLAYATFSTGFKSGGYDLSGTTVAGLMTPFRPEKVKSYEMGIKTSLFDKHLIVNLAGYYADYTDLQVQEFNQSLLQFITSNAGRSRIPGVEAEVIANPFRWLTLNGSYTYMDAKYKSYINGGGDDFSGNQIPFDAKSRLNLGGDMHFQLNGGSGGEFRIGGDVTFQSSRHFADANDEPAFLLNRTPIHGLVNLQASWTSADKAIEVSIWGKNVTNRRFVVFATDLTPFFASPGEYFSPAGNKMFDNSWNARPTFGISLTYKR